MAASDCIPLPLRATAFRLDIYIEDTDGVPVTGFTTPTAELSKDDAAFVASTNAPVYVGNGYGYLDLTAAEMTYDGVAVFMECSEGHYFVKICPASTSDITVNVVTWRGTQPGNVDGNSYLPANVAAVNGNTTRATTFATDLDNGRTAAIQAKTDNLPSDPADASVIAAAFTAVDSSLTTLATYVDTEVAAIKAKTDNLPTDPADASDVTAAFATVNSTLTTIATYVDTEVAAIKAKTDNIPASPASETTLTTINTKLGTPAGASVSADILAIKTDTAAVLVDTGTDGVVVASGSKTGYSLASDGLDDISVTAPTGPAENFREMAVQLWKRFFGKVVYDGNEKTITTFNSSDAVVTTQETNDVDGVQTIEAAE